MAAGIAQLKHLREKKAEIYSRLEALSAKLVEGVAAAAKDAGVPLTAQPRGIDVHLVLQREPVTDWASASKSDSAAFGRFFRGMLDAGIYLPPSQFEAAFLGATHTEEDVEKTIAAARGAFATAKKALLGAEPLVI